MPANGNGNPGLPGDPAASATAQQPGDDLAARMAALQQTAGPQSSMQGEDDILKLMRGSSFGDVPLGGGFRLLPTDQEIEALIKKVTTKTSAQGNKMVALELEVTFPTEFSGVKLFDQCVLVDNSLWKLKSVLSACGLLSDDGTFTGSSLQELVDYVIRFRIKHEEYQGVARNKILGGYMEAYQTPGLQNVSEEATGAPSWE